MEDELTMISKRLLFLFGLLLMVIGIYFILLMFFLPEVIMVYPAVYFIVGMIGSSISIYQRIKDVDKKEITKLAGNYISFLLIVFMGGFFAIILFVMFSSGLVKGELFPEYETMKLECGTIMDKLVYEVSHVYPKDYFAFCKSIFWSFFAGFSERFVFNLLSKYDA